MARSAGPHRHSARRLLVGVAAFGLVASLLGATSAQAQESAGAAESAPGSLEMYTAEVTTTQAAELARSGLDLVRTRVTTSGVSIDLVLSDAEADALRARGVDVSPALNADGKTSRQLSAEQAAAGFTVWRSYDEAGGIRDELYDLAEDHPDVLKLVVLGTTSQGREIIGMKMTADANEVPDGDRPAVLNSSAQHAREWISVEVNRRLLHHYLDLWVSGDEATVDLLGGTELWFVVVANPDGYQYTFDTERLWRKNLRDNDGDGEVSPSDGVDPNRNFPEHWGYDEEGSSPIPSSGVYRGPSAGSEPETQAIIAAYDRAGFVFHVNWHSAADVLLYAQGWQIATPTADDPIYYALSGNHDRPAVRGWDVGLSSDVLYVTNGETTDYAHSERGALAWTPELGEGIPGSGFVFPDDEDLVQAEFEKVLPFARDVIESATDPANPVSHLGLETKAFYLKSADTYKTGVPQTNHTFKYSYGDPQEVRVTARKDLGSVRLKYRINGGDPVKVPTAPYEGGERYGAEPGVYYEVLSGTVTGTEPGDRVKVRFKGGGERSKSFTYRAVEESDADVLVVAAEDYTGASPAQPGGPNYLDYYGDALAANDAAYDVYDVDARSRTAPDSVGVLSHYDAVIWYTGDDVVTREADWGAGTASRLAMDEILEMREFLNSGGRILYTGKWAGSQYTTNVGTQRYDPTSANAECASSTVSPRCRPLGGSGDFTNDVLQYWLGAYLAVDSAGSDDDGNLFDANGVGKPFEGLGWGFNGSDSAENQDHSNSFLTTSGFLDPKDYPQFESWVSAQWEREGGPFEPHTGDYYVYSQIADVSYKRLTRTIDVPAGGGELSFWTSYDTELLWDHVFVEARTPGEDDWTTLPDLNGHTSQETGDSCPEGWRDLHPQLDHYQTFEDGSCTPTGTTGEWWAASGSSAGWQQWAVDLEPYAGGQVEISIAYASDWSTQGLGVFIDDIEGPDGDGSTSFEDGLDGWEVTGPPPGSGANGNNFERTTAEGFPEGAAVSTPDSLITGFGLEGITGADSRADVMGRALEHLLR